VALLRRLTEYEDGAAKDQPMSFLGCLIGGNFSSYDSQRQKLLSLSNLTSLRVDQKVTKAASSSRDQERKVNLSTQSDKADMKKSTQVSSLQLPLA
jgi:hypothetical protein